MKRIRKRPEGTFRGILGYYLKPYSLFLVCTVVCAVVYVASTLVVPYLAGLAIDCMAGAGERGLSPPLCALCGDRREHRFDGALAVADEPFQQPHRLPRAGGHPPRRLPQARRASLESISTAAPTARRPPSSSRTPSSSPTASSSASRSCLRARRPFSACSPSCSCCAGRSRSSCSA